MPSTAKGYPYPANTEPVAGGAAAIKGLADYIDAREGAVQVWDGALNLAGNNWIAAVWDQIVAKDTPPLDAAPGNSGVYFKKAGLYLVTCEVGLSGQTGAGGADLQVALYTPASAINRTVYSFTGNQNFGLSLACVFNVGADWFMQAFVKSMANGASGSAAVYLSALLLR